MSATFVDFLSWEKRTRDTLDFKKIYIDMAGGDILAGLALSEIVYWYLPDDSGQSKLRIKRDDQFWIVSARYEWWDRCRMTPRQSDRALKRLKTAGLIITQIFKWDDSPTVHIQIAEDKFVALWNAQISHPAQNPFLPNGENHGYHQTVKSISPNGEILYITETTTTESTTESTIKSFADTPSSGQQSNDPDRLIADDVPIPDLDQARQSVIALIHQRVVQLNEPTQQRLFGALCAVWHINPDTMTPTEEKGVGLVAKELRHGKARPLQVFPFKRWLDDLKEREGWSTYTIFAMKSRWSQFLTETASRPALRPAAPILTLQEKMAKARLIRSLYAQDRGDEAQEVRDDDPRIAQFIQTV